MLLKSINLKIYKFDISKSGMIKILFLLFCNNSRTEILVSKNSKYTIWFLPDQIKKEPELESNQHHQLEENQVS